MEMLFGNKKMNVKFQMSHGGQVRLALSRAGLSESSEYVEMDKAEALAVAKAIETEAKNIKR